MSKQEMKDERTRLSRLRELVANFVAERDWEQFHTPENLALSVSLEAAELLEIFQWKLGRKRDFSGQPPSPGTLAQGYSEEELAAMRDELADIQIYLVSFFNRMDWDIMSTVEEKMERNKKKYPVALFKGKFEKQVRGTQTNVKPSLAEACEVSRGRKGE